MFSSTRMLVRASAMTVSMSSRPSLLRPFVMSQASIARRQISTVKSSDDLEEAILVAQRKNRPISPHLDIYQKQLTAVMSALHRITGVALAVGFYTVTCGFAASSILGYNVDPSVLVDFAASLPTAVDYTLKTLIAVPFAFHFNNGIRHLIWDAGKETTLKAVYKTGYTAIGVTAIMSVALILL